MQRVADWWGGVSRYSSSRAGWKTNLGLIQKAAAGKWPCDTLPARGLHRALASSWSSSWQPFLKCSQFSGNLDGCGAEAHKVGRIQSHKQNIYMAAMSLQSLGSSFFLSTPSHSLLVLMGEILSWNSPHGYPLPSKSWEAEIPHTTPIVRVCCNVSALCSVLWSLWMWCVAGFSGCSPSLKLWLFFSCLPSSFCDYGNPSHDLAAALQSSSAALCILYNKKKSSRLENPVSWYIKSVLNLPLSWL